MKPITQSRFIRGLNATFGIFSQPDGTVPRLSNLMPTKRGSLTTCGGSQILAEGTVASTPINGNAPIWLDLFLYQTIGTYTVSTGVVNPGIRKIYGLIHMATPPYGSNQVWLVTVPGANEAFPYFDPTVAPWFIYNFGVIGSIRAIDSALGGVGGGGGGGINQGQHLSGMEFADIPMILQFTSLLVICLGNANPVYTSDGTPANTLALTANTFSAQYPSWQPNVAWPAGDMIQDNIAGTFYLFKAIQGGVSGTTMPNFSTGLHVTYPDGTVIWQNIGTVSTSPVPRGAAHGINYAGSLWLANTAPSVTADGLDGPSAIRMSDINSYNSWNPLNAAQLGLGDGTEITGFASFTISEVGISPTGSLIVFKQFSTYQIIGVFGSTNLTIQPLQTDLGNIAPRSIQFLPSFGIMRLSHLGFAITNGVNDKLISEEIRPYLFGGTLDDIDIAPLDWNWAWFSKAAQTANPPMYVCACPVIGGLPLQPLAGVTASVFATQPGHNSGFAGQTWYCRVAGFGLTAYQWTVSPEFGPFVLDIFHGLGVNIPAMPGGVMDMVLYVYQKSSNGNPISSCWIDAPPSSSMSLFNLSNFLPGNPPQGVPAALTRMFCYDLVLKAWAVVDLPWPISVLKQFRMHGSEPITVSGGFNDQTVRRILTGDTDWDGQPITWSVRGREIFGEGGSQELFMRRMIVRGFGQSAAQTMTITPTYDGQDDPAQSVGRTVQVTNMGPNQFEVRLDLQRIARNVHVQLVGQGAVEIEAMEYEVEPCEVGAPIVIA